VSQSNLAAVKEASADVRRVTAPRTLLGDRLAILVGVDDLVLEAVQAGAGGRIAGLGSETVRAPRLPLEAPEREVVVELVRYALARRPPLG